MIGFPVGLFAANAFEWWAHKVLLHKLGKNPRLPFSQHWRHHKTVRRTDYYDGMYELPYLGWNDKFIEAAMVVGAAGLFLPLFPFVPFFTSAVVYSAWNYLYLHQKAHLEVAWSRKVMPWHYDHHMGVNQNTNWCVTKPWFDYLMGTREIMGVCEPESNPLGVDLPERLEASLKRFFEKRGWTAKVHPSVDRK